MTKSADRRIKAALSIGVAAVALVGMNDRARAQEADAAEDDTNVIIVTGTSIRGAEAPIGTSLQAIDQEEMRATGISDTNDLLKTIPQVANLGIQEGRGGGVQGADSNITQARTVNLRGLGVESTLVLLNGRRLVKNGTQAEFYDLSVIPTIALQRLEVIADGASAIYGADAVGGVVNVTTKRGRAGAETALRYGFADGFDEKKFSQTVGFTWDTGDFFAAYEHYERSGLLGTERRQVTQDLRPFGGPDLRSNFAAPGTIIAGGTTYAVPSGDGTGLTPADLIAGTANREDINESRSLLPEQNQDNFFASLHQDLGDRLTFFVEGYYSDRRYESVGGSLNRGATTAQLTVPRSNPFFVHPTDPDAQSVQVNYAFASLLGANTRGGEKGWNIAGGLEYDFGGGWFASASITRGENHAFRFSEQLHSANLAQVLSDSNPDTAFNPFCDPRRFACIGEANRSLIMGYNDFNFYSDMWDITASASGPLFSLPGGEVSLAVGGEYRTEGLDTQLEFLTSTPQPMLRGTFSERTVEALFGELIVPLVGSGNAMPGIERLQLVGAVRYDHYSDFGGTTNPKFGIDYEPVDGFTIRASYSKSFRAPSLADVDLQATLGYVPASFNDPQSNQVVRAIQMLGARDGLGPERATIWTVGADLAPVAIPGLDASLTYYNIDYKDRLATIGTSAILANPDVFGRFINRNPSLQEVQSLLDSEYFVGAPEPAENFDLIIDGRVSNLGSTRQSGLDGDISYSFAALGGDATLGAQFNLILTSEESTAEGLPFNDNLGLINFPIKFRGRAHAGWRNDGFSINAFLNHVGGYTNNLVTPDQAVSSWQTVDLSIAYDFGPGSSIMNDLRLQVSLVNALDEDPPLVINTGAAVEGAFDSQNASVIGRFVAFEISKKW